MRHIHLEPVFINHIFAVASEGNSNRKLIQTGRGGGVDLSNILTKKPLVMVMYNFAKKRGGGSVLPLPGSGAYDLYT